VKRLVLAIPAILILLGLATVAAAGGSASKEPLETLEGVFREGNVQGLRQLVSRGEKIYLSSPSLGFEDGYYSGDQVCLLIQEVFRSRITVRFNFLKGADLPPDTSRIASLARWTYRIGKSKDRTVEIAFTLIRRDGGWTLKEVRDVP
jgi:hypothetical protein